MFHWGKPEGEFQKMESFVFDCVFGAQSCTTWAPYNKMQGILLHKIEIQEDNLLLKVCLLLTYHI